MSVQKIYYGKSERLPPSERLNRVMRRLSWNRWIGGDEIYDLCFSLAQRMARGGFSRIVKCVVDNGIQHLGMYKGECPLNPDYQEWRLEGAEYEEALQRRDTRQRAVKYVVGRLFDDKYYTTKGSARKVPKELKGEERALFILTNYAEFCSHDNKRNRRSS